MCRSITIGVKCSSETNEVLKVITHVATTVDEVPE